MPPLETRDSILDAAERLFAVHGFEATSLRTITAEAGVNLAAVNYHFQSKEALLHAVYERRVVPVNRRRLELLSEYEASVGDGTLDVEPVLEAFLKPVFEVHAEAKHIARLLMRLQYTEPEELWAIVFERYFRPVKMRFFAAMKRAVPHLDEDALFWRMQFMIGSFAHVMAQGPVVRTRIRGRTPDTSRLLQRMVRYAAAGLKAED